MKNYSEMNYKEKFFRFAWAVPLLMVAVYVWLSIFSGFKSVLAIGVSVLVGITGLIQFFRLYGDYKRNGKKS